VRNSALHAILEAFTTEAAGCLAHEAESGAEVPFELVAAPGERAPLYCYRPLTGRFIADRHGRLAALASYAPAARALAELETTDAYLQLRDARPPRDPRARADATLRAFLTRVFAERSRFGFERERFEAAYAELELALYEGRRTTTVLVPLLGLALDHHTRELVLGEGLSLVRADALDDVPAEALAAGGESTVLAVLRVIDERSAPSPVGAARKRFRRLLRALRLFERGAFALGPLGWARIDSGSWRPVALGSGGHARSVTFLRAEHEDELRAFHSLIARRPPASPEVAWALARFEMGCERATPVEALTDWLLALRALLEPEGPGSARLAGRLAAVCAQPHARAAMTERAARAVALEHAVIGGLDPGEPEAHALVEELGEHLRAILRDVLCGHLDADVCGLADELIAEAAVASHATTH